MTGGPDQKHLNAKQAAKFCIFAPLAAFVLGMSTPGMRDPQLVAIITLIGQVILMLIGLVLGVYALLQVRKFGKEGIFAPALTGTLLSLVAFGLFGLGIAAGLQQLRKQKELAKPLDLKSMPQLIAGSTVIINEQPHYRIEIPPGFTAADPATLTPRMKHSFQASQEDGSNIIINIQTMGGIIPQSKLTPEEIATMRSKVPPGANVEILTEQWNGYEVDCFYASNTLPNGIEFSTRSVQIPLIPEAIQVNVGSTLRLEDEQHAIVKQVLQSLIGKTNWRK